MARVITLIGYDGSEAAEDAIRAASVLFPGAAAVVVSVRGIALSVRDAAAARAALPDDVIASAVEQYEAAAARAAARTAERGAGIARATGLDVTTAVVSAGSPWRGLLAAAREHEVAVIVCGASGRGAVSRAVLGSTTAALLHGSPVPVLVVPADGFPGNGPVLIGYDGSEEARAAIAATARLLPGRRAIVAHAWTSPVRRSFVGGSLLDAPLDEIQQVAQDLDALFAGDAEELAEEGAALAGELGLDAQPRAVEAPGAPWRGLHEAARAEGAALVAVGSRGRGAIAAAVLGSVSSGLAHNAALPVLVVGAPED